MKPLYPFAPLLWSVCLGAQASVLSSSELPTDIQNCLLAGTCSVSANSSADFGNRSFFDYTTFTASEGMVNRQLVRYTLASPSAKIHARTSSDDSAPDDFSHDALADTVWLAADNHYDLAHTRHTFTLYLEKVSPPPDNLWVWGDLPLTKIISVSTAELLAGHGQYTLDYLNGYAEQGGLRLHAMPGDSGYPYLSCIECSVNIDFNLIGLQYLGFGTTAMLAMNAADTRSLLYQESSYQYEGSYYGSLSQAFHVTAVPEPASWGLLLAGLGLVGAAARHRMNP